jgi:hypothetical protein
MANMPPVVNYIFDSVAGRWRSTATGRFISHAAAIAARDNYITAKYNLMSTLASQLNTSDVISIQRWTLDMRAQIKSAYVNEYLLGRGGIKNMTQADWGRIGGMLKNQYHYLNNFAADIAKGMSPEQIALRARMYIDSATQAYERAQAISKGLDLPAYPGDGTTECRSNCKCHWEIITGEDAYSCYWRLEPQAEHCDTCDARSGMWNPLVFPRLNNANTKK